MTLEPALLTIAITTYNRAAYLEELLRLLNGIRDLRLEQNALEILILDNASTDSTPEVCRKYATNLPYTRVIRQKANLGFTGNLRTAFIEARGGYVWTLCDDDLAHPEVIPVVISAIRAFPGTGAFVLNRDVYDVTMSKLLKSDCIGITATKVCSAAREKVTNAGHLLTASCAVIKRMAAMPGFDDPSFLDSRCETLVLGLHALKSGDLVVLGGTSIRYREGNNGSWNVLWPWIYFYNMPMVVHGILDHPASWEAARSFVAVRPNDLLYNACYLAASPMPIIRAGYNRDELSKIYSGFWSWRYVAVLAFTLPRLVPRCISIGILYYRGMVRLVGDTAGIGDLMRLPIRGLKKIRGYRAKEKISF